MLFRLVYSALLILAAPILLLGLYKKKPGKPEFGSRWKEHWGFTPIAKLNKPLWIHSVSVGESIAVTPVIEQLKAQHPELDIVVTTTTSTGAEQISKLGDLVTHRYMPLDFAWCVRGFLRAVEPSQLLIVETELWPNTLNTVAKAGIPITVINARLSQRSCERYAKLSFLRSLILKPVSHFSCQFKSDAERFIKLGVPKERVSVSGSIKFDIQIPDHIRSQAKLLRKQLGAKRPIWIAASTHQSEDEVCFKAHQQLLKQHPDALLIIVPRHPERFDNVEQISKQFGLSTQRRTQNSSDCLSQVYLADTMGEMLTLIGAADFCFVGGSLVGNKVGGHNLLEPAALGKPILNGPSYFNFTEITESLLAVNAVKICHDADDLYHKLLSLIDDKAHSSEMGQAALSVVESNRGAIQNTLGLVDTAYLCDF